MDAKQIMTFRVKMQYAVASPQEQQRQLHELQSVIMALLGLGTDTGGVAVLGSLGDGRQN